VREFEISSPVEGGLQQAWETLTDFSTYGEWNHLIPFAEGSLSPGSRLELRLSGPGGSRRPFRPIVVAAEPPRKLVLEASVGHRSLIHMVHHFTLSGSAPTIVLQQRWEATGALVAILWPLLRAGMARFDRLATDLDACLADRGSPGHDGR
jgi:hypothetical protein